MYKSESQPPPLALAANPPAQILQKPVIIERTRGWSQLRFNELWEFRDLLRFMVLRDIKTRYRQTALGPLWILLQPLVNMVVYTVIFGLVAKLPSENQPYAVFTYIALLPWGFFQGAVGSSSGSLLGSKDLISKVYFPRLLIPLSQVISSLVDFAISFLILIALLIYYGITPNWGVVLLPVFLLLAGMTGIGFGLWFAGLIVHFRDFGQVLGYVVRVWMYATPVVYSITLVPDWLLPIYRLNPMTQVVEGFRWALLGTGRPPDWTFVIMLVVTSLMFIGGLYVFNRSERSIVDIA